MTTATPGDLRTEMRKGSAVLARVLDRLAELPSDLDREAIGRALADAIRWLYEALTPSANEMEQADAVENAMRSLRNVLAALQERANTEGPASGYLAEAAGALALLFPVQQRLRDAALRRYRDPGKFQSPRTIKQPATAFVWSHGVPKLHALRHSAVSPRFDIEDLPPSELDEESEDDAPLMSPDELRALGQALLDGRPLPEDEADGDQAEKEEEPPAKDVLLTLDSRRSLTTGLLEAHLGRLATLHATRAVQQIDDTASRANLAQTEARLFHHVDLIAWLGESIIQDLMGALERADDIHAVFAASMALLSIDGVDTADVVFKQMEKLAPEAVLGAVDALRVSAHPEVPPRAIDLLGSELPPALRAAAVAVVADHGQLQNETITRLFQDAEPRVVAATAQAVLHASIGDSLPILEWALDKARDHDALELAAAAAPMGSTRALARVRQGLQAGGPLVSSVFAAIAVCGDERDVPALIQIATSRGEAARAAILALGWLGSTAALADLIRLAADKESEIPATCALHLLVGNDGLKDAKGRAGRWLRGEPWSATGLRAVLEDLSVSIPVAYLAVLESRARLGVKVAFDPEWPSARQERAFGSIQMLLDRRATGVAQAVWLPPRK